MDLIAFLQTDLKISKTTPIFKDKGSNLNCINYRPISLLSNINKIVEKIMHKQLYNFISKHNIIYELQFGFRCNHSTNHVLLELTEDIRNAIDTNNFVVGIFIDLQKAFDTVDHNILLHKLNYYGIRGLTNDWFKSYLLNRKQYVSIQGIDSDQTIMEYGVPQGSVLGPLLFLLYINDLHKAVQFSTTRHFADDTNLLIKNKSLKQLKKHLNLDLRKLVNWLNANKISLNRSKTELIIFKHPNKRLNYDLKIKLNGKRLYPSNVVKYLGVFIDSHLNWNYNSDFLAAKLSRANGMLAKIRHFVPLNILRTIYFSIFSSMLTYGSQIWGQHKNIGTQRIIKLQDKSIRIINFANYHEKTDKLYKSSHILKISDNITLQNFLYVHDSLNGNLPKALNDKFIYINSQHNHNTRISYQHHVKIPKVNTQAYGINSISFQSSHAWNFFQNKFSDIKLHTRSRYFCKKIITNYFLNTCEK